MGKLVAVIRREFMERVRTKWFLIATVFGPLLFLGISVLPIWLAMRDTGTADAANIVVLDATGQGLGERFVEALDDSAAAAPRPELRLVDPAGIVQAESLATAAVRGRTRLGYLVLDSATLAGERARYAGRNATTVMDMNRIGRAVDRAVLAARLQGTGFTPARIDSLTRVDVSLAKEEISESGRQANSKGRTTAGFFVAFLLYMVIVLFGQNVLRSVVEEKTSRVAEVVVASVKPEILLAGKVIGVGAVAVAQLTIWGVSYLGIGSLVLPKLLARSQAATAAGAGAAPAGVDVASVLPALDPLALVALVLFFVLGYTFYASLYAAVGSMVNSEQEAQQASLPVSMLLIASAVFLQPILLAPNGTLARVMGLLPFSAPIAMPLRMAATSVPAWEIAASIASVALGCVAALWVAARIYRVGLLMYGKRPGVGEILRWIRTA